MAGLFTRVSSAISASIHDALDGAESPDSVIRQLIRESTDNITRARTLAIEAVASEKRLGNEIEQHELSMDKWASAAKSAMSEANEDGARHALGKKIEYERLLEILTPQHTRAAANSESLKSRLKDLEQALVKLKSQKAGIVARQKGAEAIRKADEVARDLVSTRNVDDQLLRAEEMVADIEARNEAASEIDNISRPEPGLDAQQDADQLERELEHLRKA